MSSYLHFFLRDNDKFLPIGTYGRGSELYQAFNDAVPYAKIAPITNAVLDSIKDDLRSSIEGSRAEERRIEDRIQLISSFNNSVEEKIEALYNLDDYLVEAREDVEAKNLAMAFISFLYDILDEALYGCEGIDPEAYIYAGIECGDPKIEDIKI